MGRMCFIFFGGNMQDFLVAVCVAAALFFVVRTLWSKSGSQREGSGGCCGCSGCPNRSPLRDGSCANAGKHGGSRGEKDRKSAISVD